MTRTQLFGAALILIAGVLPVRAQKGNELSAAAMMQNVEKGFAAVQDFTVRLSADVDMERVRVPKMTATLYFKKPDKIHLVSPNFAMVPREGIVLNPSVLIERYQSAVKGKEDVEGRELYKIALTAREARIRPAQLTIWIDPVSWTIARMESAPYQGRSVKLLLTHERYEANIWLPQLLVASFESAVRDTTPQFDMNMQPVPDPDQPRRPPRSGKITIRYSDYKINTGLSDELFERKEAAEKSR